MKIKLNNRFISNLALKVGADVNICLEKKNTFITGKKNKILRSKNKYNLNLVIVYPNIICATSKIYKKNKKMNSTKKLMNFPARKKLFNFLKSEKNDLQNTVIKTYPRVGELIKYIESQNGCYFSRISGSGSACIGIFSNMKKAIYAKKTINLRYPKYWCVVSKTI